MLKNSPNKMTLLLVIFAVSAISVWIDLGRVFGGYSSLFMLSPLFVGILWRQRHCYFLLALLSSALLIPGTFADHPPLFYEERATAIILIWLIALLLSAELWRNLAHEQSLNQQLIFESNKSKNELINRTNAEENLISALDEAQALKQVDERLIARIGHELRTPLNNIIGFSELILSGSVSEKSPEKLNEYLVDIHDSGNMLLQFIDNMVDSSRLQVAFQRQDDEYNSLVELAPDLICECENRIVRKINSAGIAILGEANANGIIGHPFSDLLHPDFLRESEHVLNRVFSGQGRAVVQFLCADGQKINMDLSATSMENLNTNHVIIVARDVTARINAEAEQKQLEAKVRHSQKLETIGTLAGGIAHDFNNILTPVFGYLHMALDDVDKNSQTHEDLTHVLKAAQRCKDLVAQILTFSRQDEQELKPIQISDVVHEVLNLLRGSLAINIQVTHDIDAQCPPVLADPSQIHQVLMNLCTNAALAMELTGGVLDIRLDTIDMTSRSSEQNFVLAPCKYVRLAITDNGCGMDNVVAQRVFEPFFTTRSGRGTGMGLSVAHGIINNHKGQITLESNLGLGTKFEILLPEADASVEPEDLRVEISRPGKGRILFVDDEEEICLMAKQMLERLGYDVTLKLNSRDALQEFTTDPEKFDAVITDFTMPHLDGIQLANKITKIKASMPVILISGFSEVVSDHDMQEAGIRESIMKPMRPRDLSMAIWRVLQE